VIGHEHGINPAHTTFVELPELAEKIGRRFLQAGRRREATSNGKTVLAGTPSEKPGLPSLGEGNLSRRLDQDEGRSQSIRPTKTGEGRLGTPMVRVAIERADLFLQNLTRHSPLAN
jgi:hypothetical protein